MVDQAKRRCWFSAEKVLPLYQDQVAAWLHARWAMVSQGKKSAMTKEQLLTKRAVLTKEWRACSANMNRQMQIGREIDLLDIQLGARNDRNWPSLGIGPY
jgi:hypothetical protein